LDLGKWIDFLHQYPAWYRSLVVLWFVVGAVLAGGLVVLRPEPGQPKSPEGAVTPSPVQTSTPPAPTSVPPLSAVPDPTPPGDAPTVQAYFTTLRALSERFLEKQEFIEKMSGRTVEWEGLVDGVSQRGSYISLPITVQGIQPERTVYVSLPNSLRTKAFSLQKGDLVRVKGKLSLSTPNMPDVDATELTLVRPRGAS
jgi:hypothetical protein